MKTVISLIRTSSGCPSQWAGRTDDGGHFYARYRHGQLRAATGLTPDQALDNAFGITPLASAPLYTGTHGDAHDGMMKDQAMKLALAEVIGFVCDEDAVSDGLGVGDPGNNLRVSSTSSAAGKNAPLVSDMAEAIRRLLPVVAALEGALLEHETTDRPGVVHAYAEGKRALERYCWETGYEDAPPWTW